MSAENPALEKDISNNSPESPPNGTDMAPQMSAEDVAKAAARFGYGPLARVNPAEAPLPAFGGEAQPGRYKSIEHRKFANPAPLGLSAFALTTFVLSCINMGAADISKPNIVIGAAFGYGGLVQLCSGMWYVPSRARLDSRRPLTSPGRWLLETPSVRRLCRLTAVSGSPLPSS